MLEQDKIVPFPILSLGQRVLGGKGLSSPVDSKNNPDLNSELGAEDGWLLNQKADLKQRIDRYRPMLSLDDVLTWDEKFSVMMEKKKLKSKLQNEKINYYLREVERLLKF